MNVYTGILLICFLFFHKYCISTKAEMEKFFSNPTNLSLVKVETNINPKIITTCCKR